MGSALHKNITLKGKPLLKKYGIPYDLSNYQNDGYLKAGDKGYNFWWDTDKGDFETDAPDYKGKGFADLEELLSYVFDIEEKKDEYKKAFGEDAYKKRSEKNFPHDDNKLDHEVVNDFSIDAIKDNFTPPGAKSQKEELKDEIDTNDNGKVEVDEMADFQKSLDDYASKNKKGRDDIPCTTRR